MTLKELLYARKGKFDKHINTPKSDYYNGFEEGWRNAYQDIIELLEHINIDTEMFIFAKQTSLQTHINDV